MRDFLMFNPKTLTAAMKKKHYEKPISTVVQVRVENPVCAGSAQFVTKDEEVRISSQEVAQTNGSCDFSAKPWDIPDGSSTSN